MLTNVQVAKAKPLERDYSLADGRGLRLLVRANGSKLWQFRYRFQGKARIDSLGTYPEVTLAEARERRDASRKLLAAELDPVSERRRLRSKARQEQQNSFEAVSGLWFETWRIGKSPRHAEYVWRRLNADVFPLLGNRPIGDVKTPDVVAVLKGIETRGALEIAKRCRETMGQVFRYAIAHGLATDNPAVHIRPSDVLPIPRKTNYARIEGRELPELVRKIEGYRGTPTTRLAAKLLMLTFVRTGELIGALWEEIDFDAAQWRIPPGRMKMRTPHIVPLSRQAIEVLRVLSGISGTRTLLFPGERDHSKPISNNTILKALERMGFKGRMTGHGFRGLASTVLHEKGFDHMHIELQLAHQERNKVSASYNHALYLEPRTKMMQWWADHIDQAASLA